MIGVLMLLLLSPAVDPGLPSLPDKEGFAAMSALSHDKKMIHHRSGQAAGAAGDSKRRVGVHQQ